MNKAMTIGVLFLFCVSFLMIEESVAGVMGCQPGGCNSPALQPRNGKRRSICLAARALRCNEQEQNFDDNNILMEIPGH
ncbi:hypothetical protein OS493_022318 [Desmophyllum pertusum]|uniref:Uncharacterized protein n=1 Tax=Desmophyllum pertusum TaxID=174260 RepID=A0A9X0A0I1_9CNID|nr:hypothetical protein OS493_022318 [Desmophyllum pertusum]